MIYQVTIEEETRRQATIYVEADSPGDAQAAGRELAETLVPTQWIEEDDDQTVRARETIETHAMPLDKRTTGRIEEVWVGGEEGSWQPRTVWGP